MAKEVITVYVKAERLRKSIERGAQILNKQVPGRVIRLVDSPENADVVVKATPQEVLGKSGSGTDDPRSWASKDKTEIKVNPRLDNARKARIAAHELGHVLGLKHSPKGLMGPEGTGRKLSERQIEKLSGREKARVAEVDGEAGMTDEVQGPTGKPTFEQKQREKAREDAQKAKERRIKDRAQQYINYVISLGLNPRDYRKEIEQAAKNGWGRETFLKRAGLDDEVLVQSEQEAFLNSVLGDYEQVYGKPAGADLIKQLQNMDPESLATYNSELQKRMEQKAVQQQTKDAYLSQLANTYFDVWGVNPPPGYVEKAAAEGVNVYEFETQEKYKPAWTKSQRFKNQGANLASEMGDLLAGG